jgi:hypothetical protein
MPHVSYASYARRLGAGIAVMLVLASADTRGGRAPFDHEYAAFGRVLAEHVQGDLVDYRTLTGNRAALDAVVAAFDAPATRDITTWTEPQQLAFWINAYNAFTLQAIVDHYPIERRRFSLHPDNSIRQISGVWDRITWAAAGRTVTLDQIEHDVIRPGFEEPRIHFAVNCAAISCPPLAEEPYRARTLDAQLDGAARRFLASPEGMVVDGPLLRVSRIFKWYGDDFVAQYAAAGPPRGSDRERAIRGVVRTFVPDETIAELDLVGRRISFLPYDWSLNELQHTR